MIEAMEMLPCHEVLARLWDFIDGELVIEEESAVRQHLDLCNRCYPRYDFQRAYFEYARRIRQRDQAPPELRRRLFSRILQEEGRTERLP